MLDRFSGPFLEQLFKFFIYGASRRDCFSIGHCASADRLDSLGIVERANYIEGETWAVFVEGPGDSGIPFNVPASGMKKPDPITLVVFRAINVAFEIHSDWISTFSRVAGDNGRAFDWGDAGIWFRNKEQQMGCDLVWNEGTKWRHW